MLAVAGNCIEVCLTGMQVWCRRRNLMWWNALMTSSCKQIFFQLKGVFVISGNLASDVRDVLSCFRRNSRVVSRATIPCESGARLTKAYDVTIQRFNSHAKIETSQMHVLLCMVSKFCALWNFTQNVEPIHRKICNLRGGKNLTTYDILELWQLKS